MPIHPLFFVDSYYQDTVFLRSKIPDAQGLFSEPVLTVG